MGMEQLVQNVAAADGQTLPHMLTGVLRGDQAADVDEPQQGRGVPLFQLVLVGAAGLELRQLLVGIIDEGGQLRTGSYRDGFPQHDIDLFPDDAGGRVQDVDEGFIFAVQVAHEVLGALGQLEQCLCADDLAGRRRLGRVVPRQQRQIFQMISDLFVFGTHGFLPKIMQYSFTICNIHP